MHWGVDKLPKCHRVVVHIEDAEMTAKEALKLLNREDKGLASCEWVVMIGSESRESMSSRSAALIGNQPLKAIKALNFKPYCELSWVTVKLPAKERKEKDNGKEDAGYAS